MTGAELPMATGVKLAMAVGAELTRGRATLTVAARFELAPPPWLELE